MAHSHTCTLIKKNTRTYVWFSCRIDSQLGSYSSSFGWVSISLLVLRLLFFFIHSFVPDKIHKNHFDVKRQFALFFHITRTRTLCRMCCAGRAAAGKSFNSWRWLKPVWNYIRRPSKANHSESAYKWCSSSDVLMLCVRRLRLAFYDVSSFVIYLKWLVSLWKVTKNLMSETWFCLPNCASLPVYSFWIVVLPCLSSVCSVLIWIFLPKSLLPFFPL